ncbi:MAG TPA: hypothetical protein VH518_08485 [Tepidisphaeraceae bacterium]
MRTVFYLCLSVFICASVLGCRPRGPAPYFGPTLPFNEVVQAINANAEKIPSLRGEGHFHATILQPGHSKQDVSGDLTLLYARQRSLRFIGKDPLLGPIFEIASNNDRYWVIVKPPDPNQQTMWWGTHANASRVDPETIPVHPELLLEVLGIATIGSNLLEPPVPVLRFNNDADAYMMIWNARLADRWFAVKEIWYDRATLLPKLVNLFDTDGRVVLRAYLFDHKPVPVDGLPKDQWPKVATQYQLFFPKTQSKLEFDLAGDLAIKRKNVPNERSFVFPENPDVTHVINLDEMGKPTTD